MGGWLNVNKELILISKIHKLILSNKVLLENLVKYVK